MTSLEYLCFSFRNLRITDTYFKNLLTYIIVSVLFLFGKTQDISIIIISMCFWYKFFTSVTKTLFIWYLAPHFFSCNWNLLPCSAQHSAAAIKKCKKVQFAEVNVFFWQTEGKEFKDACLGIYSIEKISKKKLILGFEVPM